MLLFNSNLCIRRGGALCFFLNQDADQEKHERGYHEGKQDHGLDVAHQCKEAVLTITTTTHTARL